MVAAVTKRPKATFEAIAEPFEIFSIVDDGFISEIVWLLPISVILVVAIINLLRLVL